MIAEPVFLICSLPNLLSLPLYWCWCLGLLLNNPSRTAQDAKVHRWYHLQGQWLADTGIRQPVVQRHLHLLLAPPEGSGKLANRPGGSHPTSHRNRPDSHGGVRHRRTTQRIPGSSLLRSGIHLFCARSIPRGVHLVGCPGLPGIRLLPFAFVHVRSILMARKCARNYTK